MNWDMLLQGALMYLAAGLLLLPLVFLCPPLRSYLDNVAEARRYDEVAVWQVGAFAVLFGMAVVVLWPFALMELWQEWGRTKARALLLRFRREPRLPPEIDPDELREWSTRNPAMIRPVRIEQIDFGRYDIHCLQCSHDFSYSGLIHGFGENDFLTLGYVCSRCYRLAGRTWSRENRRPERPLCECGGDLLREGHVLCPNCGSPDVCCLYLPSAVT